MENKEKISVAILAVARYEDEFIDEWVKWHLNLGFDKIYIMDNNDEGEELKYEHENVEIIPYNHIDFSKSADWGGYNGPQSDAYNYGLGFAKEDGFTHVMLLDIDEFVDIKDCPSPQEFIRRYEGDCGMVSLMWEMYTDNGILYEKDCKPSVVETYTEKKKEPIKFKGNNCGQMKSFIRIKEGLTFSDSHCPAHIPSELLIAANVYNINVVPLNIGVIKHYRTKCFETYLRHKIIQARANLTYAVDTLSTYFDDNELTKEKLLEIPKIYEKYGIEYSKKSYTILEKECGLINESYGLCMSVSDETLERKATSIVSFLINNKWYNGKIILFARATNNIGNMVKIFNRISTKINLFVTKKDIAEKIEDDDELALYCMLTMKMVDKFVFIGSNSIINDEIKSLFFSYHPFYVSTNMDSLKSNNDVKIKARPYNPSLQISLETVVIGKDKYEDVLDSIDVEYGIFDSIDEAIREGEIKPVILGPIYNMYAVTFSDLATLKFIEQSKILNYSLKEPWKPIETFNKNDGLVYGSYFFYKNVLDKYLEKISSVDFYLQSS